MQVSTHEGEPSIEAKELSQLDAVIRSAAEEARALGILSIIFLRAENGDSLSLVVGGGETALDFTYGHKDPPYYVSKGPGETEDPALTAFVALKHHTEIPRDRIIRTEEGVSAAHEFFETGKLPTCIKWLEV